MNTFKRLDEIDLSLPLAGSEGLDHNYVSRVRSQYLLAQHQTLITQMQFNDAKAAALMTLMGVLAIRGPAVPSDQMLATPWHLSALVLMMFSILFCILSIFPRFPGKSFRDKLVEHDRFSWPALASGKLSPQSYAEFMQTSEVSQMVASVALSNSAMSSILLSKFRMMRTAFVLAIAALFLVAMIYLRLVG